MSSHEQGEETRFHEGQANAHKALDSKDERTIANKLAHEEQRSHEEPLSEEDRLAQEDPTLPAKMHGNKPSRGAQVDAQIQKEEEELLERKGKA